MADISGTNGNDNIIGTPGNDTISSGNGNDTVNAGAGNDTVYAGNGDDTVYGGSGMDTLFGENGNDIIDGGTDDDIIDGGNGTDKLYGGAGNDKISGGNGADLIYGGSGNDTIGSVATRCNEDSGSTGENGGDTIFGDGYDSYLAGQAVIPTGAGTTTIAGNDIIFAGNGNDIIWGDNGNNTTIGGNDIIYAGKGNDTVYGEGGNDRLMGEAGNDAINGGAGNDIIVGGLGLDTMTGGTGNDKFVFSAGLESSDHDEHEDANHEHHGYDHDNEGNWTDSSNAAKDVITDFTAIKDAGATPSQLDLIDLTQLLGATDLNWGGTTPTANGVWYVKDIPNNVTYVYADINGNPATPELAIKLLGLHDLTNGDFCGVKNAGVTIVTGGTTATGTITEIVDNAVGENSALFSATGLIDFNDTDFGSVHTASVAATPASYLGTFTLGVLNDVNTTVGWDFKVNDLALDYLAAGQQLVQNYSVTISDGLGGTVTQVVKVTITGTNDAPIVSATNVTGSITELTSAPIGNLTNTGTLTFTDVDLSDIHSIGAVTPSASALGSLTASVTASVTADSTGTGLGGVVTWNYSVVASAVEFLAAGQTKIETFAFNVLDGKGGSVPRTVTVLINGTNDAAIISGTSTGTVVEAGGLANAIPGTPTATGTLTDTDVDNLANTFTAVAAGAATTNHFGTYGMTAAGVWTYTLDNSNTTVQALSLGGTLSDSFSVTTVDGTAKTVTVTVNGTNDSPTISGLVVTGTQISFVATDPDNATLSLSAPFATAFGSPVITSGATTTLPATQQSSAVSGTLQVTDGSGVASVIGLYLGTSTGNPNVSAPLAAAPNIMYGFAAGDTLTGGSANDIIVGGTGADTLSGAGGNDTFFLANGDFAAGELIDGGANTDSIILTDATVVDLSGGTIAAVEGLTGSAGIDTVTMTTSQFTGFLTVDLGSGADTLTVNAPGTTDLSAASFPTVTNIETVKLVGSAGNTADTVTLTAQQLMTFTSVDLGGGSDTINVAVSGTTNVSALAAPTFSNVENVNMTGSAGADSITLTGVQFNAFTSVSLAGGTDTVNLTSTSTGLNALADGNLVGVESISAASAAAGVTILLGSQSDGFTITGSAQADTITGSSGADSIDGGAGADVLRGGVGNDTLTGGSGPDQFRLQTNGGLDTINDFVAGTDTIGFAGAGAAGGITFTNTTGTAGGATMSASDFSSRTSIATISAADDNHVDIILTAQTTSQITANVSIAASNLYVVAFNSDTGKAEIWFDDNWNTAGNRTQVATLSNITSLSGVTALTNSNFVVYDGTFPAGTAGSPINLALADPSTNPLDPITITVANIPDNWTLNAGNRQADGTWLVQTTDPSGLTVTTPATYSGAMLLAITMTWTNPDGSSGSQFIANNLEAYAPGNPIFAVSSDDNLTASSAADTLVFAQPIANDIVHNFDAAADKIDLIGFSGANAYGDLVIADDANRNAVVTLANGSTITVLGVHASALHAGNFEFNVTPTTTNTDTMEISDGAILPLGGNIINSGTISLASHGGNTSLEVLVESVNLQGGGQVILSDDSHNVIFGGASSAILHNIDNTLSGAGQLGAGQLTLINEGTILANGTNALVIDTGANIVANSGVLHATGSGGLVVNSSVANTGTLHADGGNITVHGDVSGTGLAIIDGNATLEVSGTYSQDTVFGATGNGVLILDQGAASSASISGFNAGDTLEFADLVFGAGTTITYASNANASGGTLTVADGAHTVQMAVQGQYTSAGFHVMADAAGGSDVTYSAATPDQLLVGGAGNDGLVGGNGNDFLSGYGGTDHLFGGAGADTFVFGTGSLGGSSDTIMDFSAAQGDKIMLENDAGMFDALASGALNAQSFDIVGDTSAETAATRVVYDPVTGALYYDADGTGSGLAVQFATLGNSSHPGISASDIVVGNHPTGL